MEHCGPQSQRVVRVCGRGNAREDNGVWLCDGSDGTLPTFCVISTNDAPVECAQRIVDKMTEKKGFILTSKFVEIVWDNTWRCDDGHWASVLASTGATCYECGHCGRAVCSGCYWQNKCPSRRGGAKHHGTLHYPAKMEGVGTGGGQCAVQ